MELSQYNGKHIRLTDIYGETVLRIIESYDDERSYSWVMDVDDVLIGTIGAYPA